MKKSNDFRKKVKVNNIKHYNNRTGEKIKAEEYIKFIKTIDLELDGYKTFIETFGKEFMDFLEFYNKALNIIEEYNIAGEIRLRARIKDFASAKNNTDKKAVDDVFGIEIVTDTEYQKEIIILLNHMLFKKINDKIYNKDNGYVAYHSIESIKKPQQEISLEEIIKGATTIEYKKAKHDDENQEFERKNIFSELIKKMNNPQEKGEIKTIEKVFKIILKEYESFFSNIEIENTPLMEFQFKTAEVLDNILNGNAKHDDYKKEKEKIIMDKYKKGKLSKGINAPWGIERKNNKIKAQQFLDTIASSWPFLIDLIRKTKSEGRHKNREPYMKQKNLLMIVFPFLKDYENLEGKEITVNGEKIDKDVAWNKIKDTIIKDFTCEQIKMFYEMYRKSSYIENEK